MAETLVSPGVLASEIDRSFITQGPVTAGAAIIGPTVKGPVEVPTVVTSWSDYQGKFGTSFVSGGNVYTYFTSIAAYNYFNNGGNSLLVARVVSGSYTPATSSFTNGQNPVYTAGAFATGSILTSSIGAFASGIGEARITGSDGSLYRFVAQTTTGVPADDTDGKLYYFVSESSFTNTLNSLGTKMLAAGVTAVVSGQSFVISGSVSGSALNTARFSTGSGASFSTGITLGGGVDGVTSGGTGVAFILSTIAEGTTQNSFSTPDASGVLPSGSADNIKWTITNVDTASGYFNLIIRQGNDSNNNQTILEQWNQLSLDPFDSKFISKVLGDQSQELKSDNGDFYLQTTGNYPGGSNYVRVSTLNVTTPNYLDSNGNLINTSYTASLPVIGTGSFGGADGTIKTGAKFYNNITNLNTQGLIASNYDNMISLLSNKDNYQYNVMLTPGLCNDLPAHTDKINDIISNCQDRGDCIYVADLASYDSTVSNVVSQAQTKNTSYAAAYWPWVMVQDPNIGQNVWVPASTVIGGVYAYNDSVSEPWFAPAGINRGGLSQVIKAERQLPQATRDTLYQGKVNPIATFPGTGVVVYGQKTLQTRASALDRVNVRRLLIALKSYISQVANTLVFEQNSTATRNNFLAQVNPYLENVQQRQGLYAFKVIMDDSNNTADVIDRNELVGQIYVQPTKTAEFIYLDFIVTPTGASFPA